MSDEHGEIENRCDMTAGHPCVELVRVDAAMRTIYAEGDRACGEELLTMARRIAAAHGFDVERHEDAG